MATDSRFDADNVNGPDAPKRAPAWLTSCLIGCLAMFVVALLLGGLVAFWVSRNWREWASTAASEGIKQGIDASELPPQEKVEIKIEVDRVATAFRDGRLTNRQLGSIMEKLVASPLTTSLIAFGTEKQYFDKSGLSDEEKLQGKKTIQRFLRGTIDGDIDQKSVDTALAHVADREPNGNWKLRDRVSDKELRTFLEAAKLEADEAAVTEDPETFDPSEEIKRIIDEGMNEPASPPTPTN